MFGCTHPGVPHAIYCRWAYKFFHYDGVIKKAVKALKYRFVSDVAAEFVSLIQEAFFSTVFIPNYCTQFFSPFRFTRCACISEGFNQAEILGSFVSHRLQISMHTDILLRTRETKPQVEMKNKEDRLKNMHGVFALNLKRKMDVRNQNVLLFDDVFTTGATMRAAAGVLKHNGAKSVWAVTMAR